MLAFVKSLFISAPKQEASDEDSSSISSDAVEEVNQLPLERKQEPKRRSEQVDPSTPSFKSKQAQIPFTSSDHENVPPDQLPTVLLDEMDDSSNLILSGSLYYINKNGLDFECLIPRCEIDIDGRLLVIINIETKRNEVLRIDRISHMRQHLSDSFQFFVRDGKDSGDDYGIQFDSQHKALRFRQMIFSILLSTAVTTIEAECALAEYDTKNREFVLVSKSATAKILERPSDNEMFFVIEEQRAGDEVHRIFVDNLSKEIQMWPSLPTSQVTFWGPHHQIVGITKVMFLMEMNPGTVGRQTIDRFFTQIANVLQDRNFIPANNTNKEDEEALALMDDEEFDLGPPGDVNTQREWRKSTGHRNSAAAVDSEDEESEEFEEYGYRTQPLYSSCGTSDALVHRFMEVGTNRTFVCRGDQEGSPSHFGRRKGTKLQMKIYKREEGEGGEERLETVGTVDGRKFVYKGDQFLPSKGLLHQQEKKLLVVPDNDVNGDVYLMDLEAEQVVQKWDADGTAISTMFPTFKQGQASHDPTFLCANPQNIFLMDTRMKKNAKSTTISYATNPKLTVGATDEHGHIVVGSRLGALRLYDGEANAKGDFKRAKTLLEAIREPITAVDLIKDGSWIVATTKTFLVVFCTKLAGTGKTGFETALGQKKPAPRYLTLSPDDIVKYQITEIEFAPAKFDAEEDSIVTSTGNMAVVWDFGTVKRGKPLYSIRFAEDAIKDVQITIDSENVVVAYPTAVGLFGTEKRRVSEL